MTISLYAFKLLKTTLSQINIPGRFVIADVAAKLLASSQNRVKGKVGEYELLFDLKDQLQRQMYFGIYDQSEIKLISKLLNQGDTFFDVGANIGYYSLIASQIVGSSGEVHAFEPIPQNVATLQKTISRNRIPNIKINQIAVESNPGTIELHIGNAQLGNTGWASIVPSIHRPHRLLVDTITLDDYVAYWRIDSIKLIKMDIEGAELNALKGGKVLLSGSNAPDLICEVNPYLLNELNIDPKLLMDTITGFGYSLYRIEKSSIIPLDPEQFIVDVSNVYCTKSQLG